MIWPNWMRCSLAHDEVIGEHKMLRWMLLPANRYFNVYLHRHTGSDPRWPHDHPCDNVSIRLAGQVLEETPAAFFAISTSGASPDWVISPEGRGVFFQGDRALVVGRALPRIRFRRAEDAHRLETLVGRRGRRAWTIWIRLRTRRQWGYYEPGGWRPARTRNQPGT